MDYLLSIITINFNGLKETTALLDSIPLDKGIEIIVVDNASKEDEATILENKYPHITVIRSPKNLGFAGGNNLGYRYSHGKYIFFVNNDTEFQGEWNISKLIQRMEENEHIAITCPKIRFFWGSQPIQFAGYTPLSKITLRNHSIGFGKEDEGQYDSPHPTPYAHGAAMLVRRKAIEQVGLMPECYFLYYEELDWSMMFTRMGHEIWYDPSLTIFHKESQTTGQGSPLRSYYVTRNRLLFSQRNNKGPYKYLSFLYLIFIAGAKEILIQSVKKEKQLAKATMTGICDFLKDKQGYRTF